MIRTTFPHASIRLFKFGILFSLLSIIAQAAYCIHYTDVIVGAAQLEKYTPLLKNKRVAIVANQTSLIDDTHLVDSLISIKINLIKIFSPEHGFRGNADAGEHVGNYVDKKTGLPVVSLYGTNKGPSAADLENIDVILFDLQDVGVRFYTYISTMHYVMEACAANNIEVIVLDRPNPNGFYVDGPVLEIAQQSFVGMHKIPLVHGMTVGEIAKMANEEGWLKGSVHCKLTVIPCINYSHKYYYKLPVKPSPNLPNMSSVHLYPTLGLFEGTVISVGRGTDFPFQIIGHPEFPETAFSFVPRSIEDASKNPPFNGITCYGTDLRETGEELVLTNKQINLQWVIDAYSNFPKKEVFFNSFFYKLAGTKKLKQQIISGMSEEAIRESWQVDLYAFKMMRKKYLLYTDFE